MFRTAAIILGPFMVIGLLLLTVFLLFAAIGDAVCADYNSFSNDFCDEWHYDTPPEDALPVFPGWEVEWYELSCGSGGCPARMYVLSSPDEPAGPTATPTNYADGGGSSTTTPDRLWSRIAEGTLSWTSQIARAHT
ncbi:MAG: hypothetical protein M3N53_05950 [Actinomycetota bacterium]|nr:hypothetical protein [Actinomycetota bacterium]